MAKQLAKKSELWQRIRAARRYGKKTQDQVATAAGVSRPAVALWESITQSNRTTPTAEQVMAVARETGVSPQFLMDDSVHPDDVYSYGSTEQIRSPGAQMTGHDAAVRQAQAFWAAVRFGVIAQNPRLADAFDVKVQILGDTLLIPFLSGDNLVMFSVADPAPSVLMRDLGTLLMLERAAGHPYKKALFRWAAQPQATPRLDAHFDMNVRTFADVGEAVAALLKL